MTGWNYRIVKTLLPAGYIDYAVHEVHYDDFDRPAMVTCHDVSPGGESGDEFVKSLDLWNQALVKPVLIFSNDTNRFIGEEPPIKIPAQSCDQCGREMTKRETWTCPKCGEEWE